MRAGPLARPKHSFKAVTDGVYQLRGDIKRLLNEKWPGVSRTGTLQKYQEQNPAHS